MGPRYVFLGKILKWALGSRSKSSHFLNAVNVLNRGSCFCLPDPPSSTHELDHLSPTGFPSHRPTLPVLSGSLPSKLKPTSQTISPRHLLATAHIHAYPPPKAHQRPRMIQPTTYLSAAQKKYPNSHLNLPFRSTIESQQSQRKPTTPHPATSPSFSSSSSSPLLIHHILSPSLTPPLTPLTTNRKQTPPRPATPSSRGFPPHPGSQFRKTTDERPTLPSLPLPDPPAKCTEICCRQVGGKDEGRG